MSGHKPSPRPDVSQDFFQQARDELFSHILRCGVLDAAVEHQKEWFDDTMEYLADRYLDLSDDELSSLRTLGEQYCRPIIKRNQSESETAPIGAA